MTYAEKLKDPRWQRKRLEIMERDGFCCNECGCSTETLSVHHRYYISGRHPWEYPSWALRTLCKSCHAERHELDERRSEGAPIPCEDQFETIFQFLGAGCDCSEGFIWELAVEMSMLCQTIGRYDAFTLVKNFAGELRRSRTQ